MKKSEDTALSLLDAYAKKLCADKKGLTEFFIRAGIMTKSGKFTKPYKELESLCTPKAFPYIKKEVTPYKRKEATPVIMVHLGKIEDAPHDGTFYLAIDEHGRTQVENHPPGRYYAGVWEKAKRGQWHGSGSFFPATHWLPLPRIDVEGGVAFYG
jgi:hypothetical protein